METNEVIIDRYNKYLKNVKKMNADTIVNYIYDLKAFSVFINKSLFETTEDDIKQYILDKKRRKNSANRINFSISTLSTFYKYAKRCYYMKYDPSKNIKRINIKKKDKDETYLTTYQIYETRRRLEEYGDLQLMVFFGLMISACPMKCMVSNLRWIDIKWKKKYMVVKIDDERSSILYLDDYTIEKLELLKKERKKKGIKRGTIFLTKYKGLNPLTDETISYWVNKIRKIGEFERLNFGMFKRSNLHYLKTGRKMKEEKIEIINSHRSFPTELKEEILKEVEQIKN